MRGKTAYLQAGAGIVADSDPEREYLDASQSRGAQCSHSDGRGRNLREREEGNDIDDR